MKLDALPKGEFMHCIVQIFIGERYNFVQSYKHAHKVYNYDLQMLWGHQCLFSFVLTTQEFDLFSFVALCRKSLPHRS
jgi:membrane-anchored protein YejM (alkaline phosphatase superfamily)